MTKEEVILKIEKGEYSCAVIKEGELIFKDDRRGISPLIDLNDFHPEVLNSACLFDKIIGKAAAMIAVNCKASFVWGLVMSSEALKFLKENNIESEYQELVPFISNRNDTGMCPIEDSVKDIFNEKDGCKAIRQRCEDLKSGKFKI